jgi:hypothetical protein
MIDLDAVAIRSYVAEPDRGLRDQPATALFHALLRPIVFYPGSEKWVPNDALDLSHAVVAGACADIIALDKTWKRRILATGIQSARSSVQAFYRAQVEDLLQAFEAWS